MVSATDHPVDVCKVSSNAAARLTITRNNKLNDLLSIFSVLCCVKIFIVLPLRQSHILVLRRSPLWQYTDAWTFCPNLPYLGDLTRIAISFRCPAEDSCDLPHQKQTHTFQEPRQLTFGPRYYSLQGLLVPQSGMTLPASLKVILPWAKTLLRQHWIQSEQHFYLIDDRYICAWCGFFINLRGDYMYVMKWNV